MSVGERLVIRVAGPADERQVEQCVHAAYQRYVGRMARPPAPLLQDYAELIARGVVRVALKDRRLIGVLVLWLEDDHVHIDNMAVLPGEQRRGVGSAMVAEANRIGAEAGRCEIRLYTNEAMTETFAFYPSRGFVETHRSAEHDASRTYFARPIRRADGTVASRPSRLGPPPGSGQDGGVPGSFFDEASRPAAAPSDQMASS